MLYNNTKGKQVFFSYHNSSVLVFEKHDKARESIFIEFSNIHTTNTLLSIYLCVQKNTISKLQEQWLNTFVCQLFNLLKTDVCSGTLSVTSRPEFNLFSFQRIFVFFNRIFRLIFFRSIFSHSFDNTVVEYIFTNMNMETFSLLYLQNKLCSRFSKII